MSSHQSERLHAARQPYLASLTSANVAPRRTGRRERSPPRLVKLDHVPYSTQNQNLDAAPISVRTRGRPLSSSSYSSSRPHSRVEEDRTLDTQPPYPTSGDTKSSRGSIPTFTPDQYQPRQFLPTAPEFDEDEVLYSNLARLSTLGPDERMPPRSELGRANEETSGWSSLGNFGNPPTSRQDKFLSQPMLDERQERAFPPAPRSLRRLAEERPFTPAGPDWRKESLSKPDPPPPSTFEEGEVNQSLADKFEAELLRARPSRGDPEWTFHSYEILFLRPSSSDSGRAITIEMYETVGGELGIFPRHHPLRFSTVQVRAMHVNIRPGQMYFPREEQPIRTCRISCVGCDGTVVLTEDGIGMDITPSNARPRKTLRYSDFPHYGNCPNRQ